MSRLPTPGSDDGTWGDILNDFLNQSHNPDGSLKTSAVAAAGGSSGTVADGSITTAKLADGAVTNAKLDSPTQATLSSVSGKYSKPVGGIPKTDLDSSVQTSLSKADTALQSAPVTSVAGKTGAIALVKGDVGLGNVDNTSDVNKPISTAAQTALNAKADTSSLATVATSGSYTDLTNKPTIPAGQVNSDWNASSGLAQILNKPSLATVATSGSYTDLSNKPTIPGDATTGSKGVVQLAGDLAGTAASPTVAKINGVTLPASAPSGANQVLTSTSASATAWSTPAAGVTLDTTASDIQPLGTQAAGSTGKAADAGHVHTMPRLDQVSAPTASVALNSQKITGLANGTAATDAAAYGQLPAIALPSYAPAGLLNNWDARLSAYNWKSSNMHKVRAALKKVVQGVSSMHVAFLGDSGLVGYDGTSYAYDTSIPHQFGRVLANQLGIGGKFTSGVQQSVAAGGSSSGDRWALTGSFTVGNNFIFSSGTAVGTATWTSVDIGTSVEFYYGNLSTSGFTYQIDGGTATGVTTTGASTFGKVTVSGLTNTTHTIKINATASQAVYIFGTRIWNPSVSQIHVHNLAIGGARANSGGNGQNWSSTASTGTVGLGYTSTTMLTTAGITTPDLVVIFIGSNDIFQSVTPSSVITGMTTMRNYYPNSPTVFVRSLPVTGTNATTFATFCGLNYSLADTLDCPLFDWNDWDSGITNYSGDALVGADTVHPIVAEQVGVASHLAGLVTGPMTNPGGSSGVYRLVESGSAYPARPNVPAGQVHYIGADQPTDWLDGDTWDDLP